MVPITLYTVDYASDSPNHKFRDQDIWTIVY